MSSEFAAEVEIEELPPPPPQPVEEVAAVEEDGIEEEDVAEKKPTSIPKLKAKPDKSSRGGESKPLRELRTNEQLAVREWLEALSPQGAIKVKVTRTAPEMWRGLKVGGVLTTYSRMIDEEWIRDRHGGGDYHLEVRVPNPPPHGGWKIAGHRDIHVAGDPRTDDVFRNQDEKNPAPQVIAPGADPLAKAAFASMERQLERAQQMGAAQGMDPAMIQAIMAPLQAQIASLGQMLRDSQAALAQAQVQASKPAERDPLHDAMFKAMLDGDSSRMVSMRTQHDSELRQLKQSMIDQEQRLYERFERDKQQLVMAHERELNALRSAYDMKVASQETMNQTSKTLLDGEIRRLQSDLTEAKSELAALRLKKDKTILEQASEFAQIKEAIGDITGDGEKDKGTIAQIVEVAGNLPAVQGILGKLAGEQQQQQQPQPQQQLMQRQSPLMTGPDGNLYRQLPTGELQLVRRRRPPQQPTEVQPSQPQLPEIAPATVKIAVDFLESAFRNGQDPTEVATSVRSMVPTDVIGAIKSLGIDGFLSQVARLDASSQLASQAGRNWTRKLGKALVGDA